MLCLPLPKSYVRAATAPQLIECDSQVNRFLLLLLETAHSHQTTPPSVPCLT